MNPKPINALLIEDNADDVRLIERMLKQVQHGAFNLPVVDRLSAGRAYLTENDVDVILLDLSLPDGQGLDTLAAAQAFAPTVAVVVLTGLADYELGLEAVNAGAQDCLVKGRVDADLLSRAISYAVERKQSERSLRESERKFRSVIEQSVDGIVLVDEEGLIVEWNAAHEKITGLSRADVIGQPIWDVQFQLAHEERRTPAVYARLKRMIQAFLRTGQPGWPGQIPQQEIQRPDGERRTIQTSAYAVQTHKGFMGSAIIRDVTEQVRAQQALEKSHAFLQHTLDALTDHIAILDETGTIISVNTAWREFADANGLNDPTYGLGTNYLQLCEAAVGPWSEGTHEVATGIRKALADRDNNFYQEYPCHSADVQRWFTVRLRCFDLNGARRVVVAHHNITPRKLAEEALTAERELLRTVIDHLPDRVYAKDRDGRYLINNMASVRQLGATTSEEIIGKTVHDYFPPDLADRFQADDEMVMQFGQFLINREEPTLAADGSPRWTLTTKVPLRDRSRKIIGLVGIARDITERKRTQEQMGKLHDQINALYIVGKALGQTLNLETIFSTLHAAIVEHMACDGLHISSYTLEDQLIRCLWAWRDGQQLDASQFPPAPLAEAGTGSRSIVIRSGESLYLPDYHAHLRNSRTINKVREESQEVTPEEEDLSQSVLFVPMKLENRVLGVIQVYSCELDAYTEDDLRFLKALAPQAAAAVANALLFEQTQHEVFERERAEAELRELNESLEERIAARAAELRASEARYRAIIEDQTELICRSLPDTTITFANNAYCRFFGISREDIINRQYVESDVFHEDRMRWAEQYAALSPANPVVMTKHRAVGGDGKIHWLQWTNRLVMDNEGHPIEVQGVGRDITRQKQAEDVLREALTHEMDVNEMRSRFISMASHDLRTPLAVIQASADLMSLYGDRLTGERKSDVYREIDQAIRHMVTLLDNILLLGRADAGKVAIEPEPIDLKTLCQNLLTELKTAFGTDHHLTLAVTGQCERMWLDSRLVRHIFGNLVSNAIKFSPSGSAVQVNLHCTTDQVVLSVEDEGIGIPIDEQARLFETFFRGSNVGQTPGTGLGLAIVRQSVEMHGGSVTFESRPGEGTTFFVVLPCIPLEEKVDENAPDR